MTQNHKLFINGKWVASSSGRTFASTSPTDGKLLGYFQAGNSADVDRAVRAASKAFPAWSRTPPPQRGKILARVAKLLKENKLRLARLITFEMGKTLSEALGDVQEAIDVYEYMAAEGRCLFGQTTTSELADKMALTVRVPFGVVGVITPWNFPIAIPAWKISAALICGNTIVFKPATDTPLCAVELVKIHEKAGVPAGVLNMITGNGENVGTPLIKHAGVNMISFTGSRDVGEFVAANAGLKKVGLELGGKNPIIVMDDADIPLAVKGCVWGAFATTGQRCTAASRIILHKKIAATFTKQFVAAVKKLRVGKDIGPLVNKAQLEKTKKYVQIGEKEGARIACGGHSVKGRGFFHEPTVFVNAKPRMRIAREEIFGPVTCLITVNSFEEAVRVANGTDYGLSAAIYTKDVNAAMRAVRELEAGIVYVNAPTIGAEVHLPFGGVKASGNGTREAGIAGVEEFSQLKTIYIDYSQRFQRAQIDVKD